MPIPLEYLQISASGLVALAVLFIMTGRLVPRRIYLDMKEERDHWRALALKTTDQADKLLPAATLSTNIVQALSDVVHKKPKDLV